MSNPTADPAASLGKTCAWEEGETCMLDKHVRRNNVLCMEHAVALGGRVGQVFWSLTFWLKDLHPSTILPTHPELNSSPG